jgi:hypothetical protein
MEAAATGRYFDGRFRYYEAGALARFRESYGPTLGLHASARQLPGAFPVTLHAEGALFLQNPDGETFSPYNGTMEWAATIKGGVSQLREIDPKTWHRPALSLFGRILSRPDSGHYEPRALDQDIFTQYKNDHRYGAILAESLLHRPWLDTLWHGTISLSSNELDDRLTPDHLGVLFGWKQLLGDFLVNATYRITGYFDDRDRAGSSFRNSVATEFTYKRWLENLDRLEITTKIAWHFEANELTAHIGLSWHFDHGRGFRDFLTGDIDFHDLRQRMPPAARNNGMTYETD